jgi:hypothetical protein
VGAAANAAAHTPPPPALALWARANSNDVKVCDYAVFHFISSSFELVSVFSSIRFVLFSFLL